jgi:hypothetical protein
VDDMDEPLSARAPSSLAKRRGGGGRSAAQFARSRSPPSEVSWSDQPPTVMGFDP